MGWGAGHAMVKSFSGKEDKLPLGASKNGSQIIKADSTRSRFQVAVKSLLILPAGQGGIARWKHSNRGCGSDLQSWRVGVSQSWQSTIAWTAQTVGSDLLGF